MDTSAETKWTPGPWRICKSGNMANTVEGNSGRKLDELDDGFRTVAMFQACCASDHMADKEANANANGHLIAAAPELADAARRLSAIMAVDTEDEAAECAALLGLEVPDDFIDACRDLNAALKKAWGLQP